MRPVYAGIGTAAVLAVGGVLSPTALAAEPKPSADPTATTSSSSSSSTPSDAPSTPSDPPSTSPSTPSNPPPSSGPPSTTPPTTPPPSSSPPSTPPPSSGPPSASPPISSPPVTHLPSPPGSPHHRGPTLSIKLVLSSGTVTPGGTVMATMSVAAQHAVVHHAVVKLSAPGAQVDVHGTLGDLGSGARSVTGLVSVDAAHGAGTVTVTATISADQAAAKTATGRITVDAATGGSGGGSAGGVVPDGGSSFALPPVPMTASPLPDLATPRLPLVAQAPAVAPDRAEQPATPIVMRASVSPIGLDRMSLRLAVIEAGWLAGLLVTLSLLIARLRAGRRS